MDWRLKKQQANRRNRDRDTPARYRSARRQLTKLRLIEIKRTESGRATDQRRRRRRGLRPLKFNDEQRRRLVSVCVMANFATQFQSTFSTILARLTAQAHATLASSSLLTCWIHLLLAPEGTGSLQSQIIADGG